MKKKIWVWIGGALVALMVIGAIGTAVVYAQGPTPPVDNPQGGGPGPRGGHGLLGGAGLEAAAEALGMTTDELSAALKEGKTLEQLATDKGADLQTVQDAIRAAHETEMRERIQQAVDDGSMTKEKADWLIEGLDKGFLDGPGFGFGFGGPHGYRPDGQPGQIPSAQPTQQNAQ